MSGCDRFFDPKNPKIGRKGHLRPIFRSYNGKLQINLQLNKSVTNFCDLFCTPIKQVWFGYLRLKNRSQIWNRTIGRKNKSLRPIFRSQNIVLWPKNRSQKLNSVTHYFLSNLQICDRFFSRKFCDRIINSKKLILKT